MDYSVRECTEQLIRSIRSSEDYRRYEQCLAALDEKPGILGQIMELRKQEIELYHGDDEEAMLEETQQLGDAYEEIGKVPGVNAFLEAEEAVVLMLRGVSRRVVSEMGLLTPDL